MTKFMHFEMQAILVYNEIKHTLYTPLFHVDLCYKLQVGTEKINTNKHIPWQIPRAYIAML